MSLLGFLTNRNVCLIGFLVALTVVAPHIHPSNPINTYTHIASVISFSVSTLWTRPDVLYFLHFVRTAELSWEGQPKFYLFSLEHKHYTQKGIMRNTKRIKCGKAVNLLKFRIPNTLVYFSLPNLAYLFQNFHLKSGKMKDKL